MQWTLVYMYIYFFPHYSILASIILFFFNAEQGPLKWFHNPLKWSSLKWRERNSILKWIIILIEKIFVLNAYHSLDCDSLGSDEFQVLFVLVGLKCSVWEGNFNVWKQILQKYTFFVNDTQRFCRDRNITKTKGLKNVERTFFCAKIHNTWLEQHWTEYLK